MPGTVKFHRVIKTTPEKLYRAFLDSDALTKWLPPHGFTCKVHENNTESGGTYRMSFTNFSTGKSHAFGGKYLELQPNARIVNSDLFEDSNLPGEMRTTITFKAVASGTEINIVQEGIPDAIPTDGCYIGWQESLTLLALLVEPNIPD